MSENSIQIILNSLDKLDRKLDLHIETSDRIHGETNALLGEIRPILADVQAAKRVGGWISKFFNGKLGWAVLLALAGYLGLKQ